MLPHALTMAAILIVADFTIYVSPGAAVSKAKRALASTGLVRRIEQVTGPCSLALTGRLAAQTR